MATLYYRPQALETIARHILTQYDEMYLNGKPRAVPIETIIEKTFGLRIEYQYLTIDGRELGRMMNEEQIQAMYLQDLQEYRNNRIYAIHIQSVEELESDGEESRNALHKKFLHSMICTMDMSECGRFRNILQEYKDDVCIADFTCYKKEKQEGEGK